ncbi:LysR family transcriptional regulator [Dactylosporangium sp. NPDC000555]|uniref:LysR family transcriptional regulator n=1 Tax=Dactylosporangium sp. NPDC000555 TaxID=3154260 RepID=UPI00332C332F
MLNPIHLKTLTQVVRMGSFAKAGRALGYTASAVSQQMLALERATGLRLFERHSHSVRPSSGALFLAERGYDLLSAFDDLETQVAAMAKGATGRLRIGSFPTGSTQLVPRALSGLLKRRPGIDVRLDEGEPDELLVTLTEGKLDLAVVYHYDLVPRTWPTGLAATTILHEDLHLLVPPDSDRVGRPVELCDLANETWISSDEGSDGHTGLMRLCGTAGFEPRIAFHSNDYAVVRSLVRWGLGIAVVPTLALSTQSMARATSLAGIAYQRHVSLLYRANNSNPVLPLAIGALAQAGAAVEFT